jgi:hypothetical protein
VQGEATMTKPKNDVPVAFLRECFDYDPTTGVLTWKHRPREHFKTQRVASIFNAKYAGKSAGLVIDDTGYRRVMVTFSGRATQLMAHRIILAVATGAWPENDVDHINGVRDDNRFANLREAVR